MGDINQLGKVVLWKLLKNFIFFKFASERNKRIKLSTQILTKGRLRYQYLICGINTSKLWKYLQEHKQVYGAIQLNTGIPSCVLQPLCMLQLMTSLKNLTFKIWSYMADIATKTTYTIIVATN